MNKQQLASLIWEYCNAMRGSITTVEYKDIILGFIFYRFLSENEVAYLTTQLGWEKGRYNCRKFNRKRYRACKRLQEGKRIFYFLRESFFYMEKESRQFCNK